MQGTVERYYIDLAEHASDALGNVAGDPELHARRSRVRACAPSRPALRPDPGAVVVGARRRRRRARPRPSPCWRSSCSASPAPQGLDLGRRDRDVRELRHLLIQKLEQVVSFINNVFMEAPRLREFFNVLDTVPAVHDRPDAIDAGRLSGLVEFNDVTFSYDGKRPAVEDLSFTALPGQTIALVGADRRRQIDRDRAPASRLRSAIRLHQDRRQRHARRDADVAAAEYRRRVPGGAAVQPLDRGESARRQAGRDRGRDAQGGRARAGARFHRAQRRLRRPMPASAAACCPAASASGCRSPARC